MNDVRPIGIEALLAEARATNRRLNRRASEAEAAVRKELARGPGARTFGRALANLAAKLKGEEAERYARALRALRRELDRNVICPEGLQRYIDDVLGETAAEERLGSARGALLSVFEARAVSLAAWWRSYGGALRIG